MKARADTRRRGVAMLIVMACVAVSLPLAAVMARRASFVPAARAASRRCDLARDVLRAAEAPIVWWLRHGSDRVVLPPGSAEPRVPILCDRLVIAGEPVELAIAAWDQCGMLPVEAAGRDMRLRAVLTPQMSAMIDARPNGSAPFGLDCWDGPGVFPSGAPLDPLVFGGPGHWADRAAESERSGPALGALVATCTGRAEAGWLLNVSTAPMPLVEAALRAAGRSGVERIAGARAAGTMPILGFDRAGPGLRMTSISTAWSFRIDVSVGGVRRSWWSVYCRGPSGWELVQRVSIAE